MSQMRTYLCAWIVLPAKYCEDKKHYRTGFHAFVYQDDARTFLHSRGERYATYKIIRVTLKNVRYYGIDKQRPIIVAGQMHIARSDFEAASLTEI